MTFLGAWHLASVTLTNLHADHLKSYFEEKKTITGITDDISVGTALTLKHCRYSSLKCSLKTIKDLEVRGRKRTRCFSHASIMLAMRKLLH